MSKDKIHDMLMRLEIDLQYVKDAVFYCHDMDRAILRMMSINQQSKNISDFLKVSSNEK
jgi:hypothetical protein